jgi:hypothetical protein
MKVKEFITFLQEYNPEAEVNIIAFNRNQNFTICFGNREGETKLSCLTVSLYLDSLCKSETHERNLDLRKEYENKKSLKNGLPQFKEGKI